MQAIYGQELMAFFDGSILVRLEFFDVLGAGGVGPVQRMSSSLPVGEAVMGENSDFWLHKRARNGV
jgi:hypothetical protein